MNKHLHIFFLFTFLSLGSFAQKLLIKNASGSITQNLLTNLKIKNLIIEDSQIEDIEDHALCNPYLRSFTLVNNTLPKITRKMMQGCHMLKSIYISGQNWLDNKAFSDATNLESLTINGSHFGSIFQGLAMLKSLTIHSSIPTIEKNTFEELTNLEYLDLQKNGIHTIQDGSLANLTKLKVLKLSDNNLHLTWREFNGLIALKVLYLERNGFDEVDVNSLVRGLPNLERAFFTEAQLKPDNQKQMEEVFLKLNITLIYTG